ncbi:MAG: cytochrome P450, partial [Paracoccaceae bacterium]|nr:cytochrome P450 [Paracoccaceae bacterium]
MTDLMGQNMMRKDGRAHLAERRAIFPSISPKTVKDHWKRKFITTTSQILDVLAPRGEADLVRDYAMPVSAQALIAMTGLTNMHSNEMDRVSQGMIDCCSNYQGDLEATAQCHDCTASIECHIEAWMPKLPANPDKSLLSVQIQ